MCDMTQFVRSTLMWIVSTGTRCTQGIGLGSLGGQSLAVWGRQSGAPRVAVSRHLTYRVLLGT